MNNPDTGIETVTYPNGIIFCYARQNNVLIKMRYVGYKVHQARKMFREHLTNLQNGVAHI